MYLIKIDNEVVQQLEYQHDALTRYRALCNHQKNKHHKIELLQDDAILHTKQPNELLDSINDMSSNDVLLAIMSLNDFDKKTLKLIMNLSNLEIPNSRIDGWCRPNDDRRFVQMHNDELAVVMLAIITYLKRLQYNLDNIKKMRNDLNLTQTELGSILGGISRRQVTNWEAGASAMKPETWEKLQELWENHLKQK